MFSLVARSITRPSRSIRTSVVSSFSTVDEISISDSSSSSSSSDGSSSSSSDTGEDEDLMQFKDPTNRGVVFSKGAFLLNAKSEDSLAAKILGIKPKTEDKNSENGKILKVRNKHLGPNIAAFYKADGGLVIKEAKVMHACLCIYFV